TPPPTFGPGSTPPPGRGSGAAPAMPSRPVSAGPSPVEADTGSFGSRNTAARRGKQGEQGSAGPTGGRPRSEPSALPPRTTTGWGAGTSGSAVVPPVVPGHAGARSPALPGRAGAMAGAAPGVVRRPEPTATGRVGVTGSSGAVATGRVKVSAAVAPPVSARGVPAELPVPAPGTSAAPAGPPEPEPRHVPNIRPATGSGGKTPDGVAGGLRGARSELRRHLREQRRLRMITLTALPLVVLLALPGFFGIRSASRDPVFTSLDALVVPAAVARQVEDHTTGSRWCFLDCRFRERTAQSQLSPAETEQAYQSALRNADWKRWTVAQCPEQPVEGYTCWRRDEFTLDLWVRRPACAADAIALRESGVAPPDGVIPDPQDPKSCPGATVSIKVRNAITDERGRGDPRLDPSRVGVTPEAVLPDNPLVETTPSPS
ncbi:MAG TPA: hypothetical protein VFO77_09370, partial [Actinoplanes sp.]|nr:hypothetical protein [Actinoplanes sp.]